MKRRVIALVFASLVTVGYSAPPSLQIRLNPTEVDAMPAHDAGTGTSGVAGIRTTVIAGNPAHPGPYTIRLMIPPNTRIRAHTHRDNRTAVVVAGTWYFGYGDVAHAADEKALPAGSFYTEPAGVAHFAETKVDPVIVYITGEGPSDTIYVKQTDTANPK
jgi:quercetin dioxygenase-like cupin family protein